MRQWTPLDPPPHIQLAAFPRHHASENFSAGLEAGDVSAWVEFHIVHRVISSERGGTGYSSGLFKKIL